MFQYIEPGTSFFSIFLFVGTGTFFLKKTLYNYFLRIQFITGWLNYP
jgi:hypothetical protein